MGHYGFISVFEGRIRVTSWIKKVQSITGIAFVLPVKNFLDKGGTLVSAII